MDGRGIVRLGAMMVGLLLALSGCHGPDAAPTPTPTTARDVIDFSGLPGLPIGASLTELTGAGAIATDGPGCGPAFTSTEAASPIFDADRLVLIWAYPPLHTPENITVGTSVADARAAYPGAVELTPPAGSHQYPGLLVTGPDDRGYLLLYDTEQIQKLVVGIRTYARMLFDTGYGAC